MAPKSKASFSMKQGTLSFASSKRGGPAATAGKNAKSTLVPVPAKPQATAQKSRNNRSSSIGSTISISSSASSGNDDELLMTSTGSTASAQHAFKRLKTTSGSAKAINKLKKPIDESSSDEDEPQTPRTSLDNVAKTVGVHRLYDEATMRMGEVPPIHSEKLTEIHHILRVFDLSYKYGPCVGMTRLQRWKRADALDLNPPTEVFDILKTEEAKNDEQYKQSVFYDSL